MNHWRWFFNQWRGHFLYGLFLVGLTIVSASVAMAFPLFFRYLIDTLSASLGKMSLQDGLALRNHLLLILFGIGGCRFIAAFYPAFRAKMNSIIEKTLRLSYFDKVMESDHRFFIKFRTGDVVTRLTDDLAGYPKVAWFACSGFFRAFNSTMMVLCCISVMLYLNWRLACIALLPLPFALLIYVAISSKLREAYDTNRKYVSKTSNHLEACFSGVRILKAYNAEKRECSRFGSVLDERFEKEMNVVRLSGKLHTFFHFVSHAAQVLVVLAGGIMVLRGSLTLGEYFAFFTYLGFIVYPMLDLPNLLVTSRQAFVCVDRLEELRQFACGHELPHEVKNSARLEGPIEDIVFHDVSFSYGEGKKTVLDELTFKMKKGERIAIVGQIGSGKTTLLNLLAGILKPTTGQILVNDVPVTELEPTSFHERIGYIGQDPVVFSETIAQNIRFWREHEREHVENAAAHAQLRTEIEAFPQGFEQKVGQRGVTISGGQKQRLTIARAVVGKPELLVMDDVTASLDADSEEAFWKDMEETYGNPTVIIVTHRLATARRADRILLLENGRISETGTFEALASKSEAFRRMVNID